ncbi:hypothetical protein G6F34_013314 [Rhizopus arrhizus]|nr:hypothetical protein G6F34_013314 [Rhizopus arrhizus]
MMVESNSSMEEWMDGAAVLGSREPEETAEVVIPEDCASEDKLCGYNKKVQEIDANNEIIEANKNDSDEDNAEDVSNWEVIENDEVNLSDSMDIVEFDMPQGIPK